MDYNDSIKNPGSIDEALAREKALEAAFPALAAEREARRNDPMSVARAKKQVEVSTSVAQVLLGEDGIHTLIAPSGNLVFTYPDGRGFQETPWTSFGLDLYTVEEWIESIRASATRYKDKK
jgi:hypothetical protein